MGNRNKFIVIFAAPPGTSKTPIAFHLSYTFNLPIFNTDAIRSEVTEDLLHYDIKEFEKRRDKRLKEVIDRGNSFILDASVDREWEKYKKWIDGEDYEVFVISLNLSKKFLTALFDVKLYQATMSIDKWMNDHKTFLEAYSGIVNVTITDSDFKDRLEIVPAKLNEWLNNG